MEFYPLHIIMMRMMILGPESNDDAGFKNASEVWEMQMPEIQNYFWISSKGYLKD